MGIERLEAPCKGQSSVPCILILWKASVHFNHLKSSFKKCSYLDPKTVKFESSGRGPEHVFFCTMFMDDSDLQPDYL